MGTLTVIILIFTLIQLIIALTNLAGTPPLPPAPTGLLSKISILIPARNEAANLPYLLKDLLSLPEQPLEILICDDHSTDTTFPLAHNLSVYHSHIRVFKSLPLPAGWQGKNFACYQLARKAKGRYLLFLDADVRIQGDEISATVARMQMQNLSLLSVFPRQIMLSAGEKATVPLMTYILLTLLPLPLVYAAPHQSALSAANGQYMLFETETYRRLQPHRKVSSEVAEDIAISRYYKNEGRCVACLTGLTGIACRMYHSHEEAVRGFARNIAAFFGGSLILAVLFGLLTAFGWIPVLIYLSWTGLIAYLLLQLSIRIFVSLSCQQSVTGNLLWAFPQQINMLLILLQAFHDRCKKYQEWKGRNIL